MRASVVVPTFRRPDLLARCLDALAAQQFDTAAFEVIIADDADDAITRAQVAAFGSGVPFRVQYVAVSSPHGPAAARNAGWRTAGADVIAFTDDDCIPSPYWLSAGTTALEKDGTLAAVTGRVVVPLPEHPTDYERDAAGLAGAEFVTADCFCRRSALEAVGGFDVRFSAAWREDSDLQFSLLEAGLRIGRAPDALAVHPVRPAPWGVSLRQQRKVLWDALLYKKHPLLYRQRIRRRPRWDYYATVAALGTAAGCGIAGLLTPAFVAAGVWTLFTGRFAARRLRGVSHAPRHVAEMLATSALIPAIACFWRLYGAAKFRTVFL
jgi:glycosyltransferase involved in cell wall biosynthesis